MKTLIKKSAVTAAAVCTCISGIAGMTVFAQDTQDKLDSANSAIEQLRKEQSNISTEITDLNKQAEAAGQRINELNDDIIDKQDDIAVVNAEIVGIEDDMADRYEDMKLRIRYVYESGDMGLVDAVLGSEEFSEALNRAEYIQKIYDYDRNQLEIMAGLYNEHENKLNTLESEMANLENLKAEADKEARSLEALLVEKKDELTLSADKLKDFEELAKKYERQLEEERLAREEEERKKREEAERKAKEEAERKAAEEAAAKQAAQRQAEEAAAKKKAQEEAAAAAAAANNNSTTTSSDNSSSQSQNSASNNSENSSGSNNSSGNNSSTASTTSSVDYSQNDLALLSCIIEVEAGNQSYEGRLAVGSVVMNRVESSKFPNTIAGVIYQSGQFTPVASGRFAACLARGAQSTNVQAAKDVLGGVRNVPYLFFRTHRGQTSFSYSSYTIIDDHVLYNY